MTDTVVLDFLSDPMGGLLTSAVAFLDRVRKFDENSRLVVIEANRSVSTRVGNIENFDWVSIEREPSLSGWRRMAWQNLKLPRIAQQFNAGVYVSLSHYLPITISSNLKSIVGISNLAPFSDEAYEAEIDWRKKLRLRVLRRTIISSAKRADRVIALSNTCRMEMVSRGVAEDKIVVIPNGVANSSVDSQGQSEAPAGGEYILYVSHFYRYKNFERLIRAYALLPEELRSRYKLVLVGAPYDSSYFESVRELIYSLRLQSRVSMVPGVYGAALVDLYRFCSLFVFPSLIENSPITLLEAMKNGAPIAAADVPAMREFGGDAVAYFDPLSVNSISRVMNEMLASDEKRASLRGRARDRVKLYDWDNFSRKMVELYKDVLN